MSLLPVTGQSVGSGPTCHLGAKVPGLAGVILHSPLATGMRVMNPTWTRWPSWLDVFPNIKLISKINAPMLIMHVRPWLPPVEQLQTSAGLCCSPHWLARSGSSCI